MASDRNRIISDGEVPGAMYIIENDELGQEGLSLGSGDDGTQYISHGHQLQMSSEEGEAGQSDTDEASYMGAGDTVISAADDNNLVINTDEGQILLQQDQIIDNTMQPLEIQTEITAVTEAPIDEDGEYQNLIIQHMDISEPLTTLRRLLEQRLSTNLTHHEFYLQDVIQLEPTKNLTSQCVQGSGMVQINVEVKSQPDQKPRLNIVDILKPAEEVVEMQPAPIPQPTTKKVVIPFPEESENVTRWIVDQNFRREQERLKIPFDPSEWNEAHVKHWIQWAIKEFTLVGVDVHTFMMSGSQLCDLKHDDFMRYIPHDKGDVFWTHLELLRKCKFVAVIQQPTPHAITTITVSTTDQGFGRASTTKAATPKARQRTIAVPHTARITPGNRTGNNGQIQLWQFLLELLTDKDYLEIIHWVGEEGEFKLNNPEVVAQLWGQRKNKPTMNYEKLSRALRYYYDGDMIAKVHGKRFVYKFVCDLRNLLGYTASELKRLVTECAEKYVTYTGGAEGLTRRIIQEPSRHLMHSTTIHHGTLQSARPIIISTSHK